MLKLASEGNYGKVSNIRIENNVIVARLVTMKWERNGDLSYMVWQAKFVGKAITAARFLPEGAKIKIKNAYVETQYVKEAKTSKNTIVIQEFEEVVKAQKKEAEVRESKNNAKEALKEEKEDSKNPESESEEDFELEIGNDQESAENEEI